jgi:transposase-like protein
MERWHAHPSTPPGLYLYLDGKRVEVRMQGQCLYAELLADTEFQTVKADVSAVALAEVDTGV